MTAQYHAPRAANPVGLTWDGRWGRWADPGAIQVLAACVGDFELVPVKDSSLVQQAMTEVSRAVMQELPSGAVCVNLHWRGRTQHQGVTGYMLRVAFACDASICANLQKRWQDRALCNGRVLATWRSVSDAGSQAHSVNVSHVLAKRSRDENGCALDLPVRWMHSADQRRSLRPGDHWFDFASIFGDVLHAELMAVSSNVIRLLVCFAAVDGARAMYEALTERYLYNPQNRKVDDTYPVTCTLGVYEDLVKRSRSLLPPEDQPALAWLGTMGNGYLLKRVGNSSDIHAGPASFEITPSRSRLTIGREACHVTLRRVHISKVHAVLELRQVPDARSLALVVRDTSANGTWVNGKRLDNSTDMELRVGDHVSFLPLSHMLYPDSLLYEVCSNNRDELVANNGVQHATTSSAATGAGRYRQRGAVNSDVVVLDHLPNKDPKKLPRAPSASTARRSAGSQSSSLAAAGQTAQGSTVSELTSSSKASSSKRPRVSAGSASKARSSAPPDQLAQPVSVDRPGYDGVIELSDEAPRTSRCHIPATEDIPTWLNSLDGGSLEQYQTTLTGLFDSVSQIKSLYTERLNDFYLDVKVTDPNHRLAFATALRALRNSC